MNLRQMAMEIGGNRSAVTEQSVYLFRLDWNGFTLPVNGFLMPLVALVTLLSNTIVLRILLRRQMRSPTNALLAALAVSDSLTSMCPVPCFIRFYTVGQRYLTWVPFSWCFAYFCLTDYLPTIFHTASIWLTASLAVQRYVRVCCPVGSPLRGRLCTINGSVGIIVGVYVAAVASQLCRFGELTFTGVKVPLSVTNSTRDINDEVVACRYQLTPFVARHEMFYFNVYYWSRVLLIHVIPCTALVGLNARIVRTMRSADLRRSRMSRPPAASTPARLPTAVMTVTATSQPETQQSSVASSSPARQHGGRGGDDGLGGTSRRTTMMLVIVVGVFLLVEVPLSALLLIVIVENTFDADLVSDSSRYTAALLVNCSIVVTYPLNFVIYCAMSQRFRCTFCHIFCRRASTVPDNTQVRAHRHVEHE